MLSFASTDQASPSQDFQLPNLSGTPKADSNDPVKGVPSDCPPLVRPKRPFFSSGPCAKPQGWSFAALDGFLQGRSHRSPEALNLLGQLTDELGQLLNIPKDHVIALWPGSATGAIEAALWNLLGPAPVDILNWDVFSGLWAHDIARQLGLGGRIFQCQDLSRVWIEKVDSVGESNKAQASKRQPNVADSSVPQINPFETGPSQTGTTQISNASLSSACGTQGQGPTVWQTGPAGTGFDFFSPRSPQEGVQKVFASLRPEADLVFSWTGTTHGVTLGNWAGPQDDGQSERDEDLGLAAKNEDHLGIPGGAHPSGPTGGLGSHDALLSSSVPGAPKGQAEEIQPVDSACADGQGASGGQERPDLAWLKRAPGALVICDATSAVLTQALPWRLLDACCFSWQKGFGGEASLGVLVLGPRALERLASWAPPWPIPRILRLRHKGSDGTPGAVIHGVFEGQTVNTISLLLVQEALWLVRFFRSHGGLAGALTKAGTNAGIVYHWAKNQPWCGPVMDDQRYQPWGPVVLTAKGALARRPAQQQWAFFHQMADRLADYKVGYELVNHPGGPPALRIWCGPTVEAEDLRALTAWMEFVAAQLDPSLCASPSKTSLPGL